MECVCNDISCGTKDNERECLANAKVVSIYAKKFGIGQCVEQEFGMCTERVCLLSLCCFSFIVMMMSLHLGSGPLSLTCCVCLMANGMKKWSSPSSLSSPSVLVWFLAAPRKQHSCLHLYRATTQWSFIGPGSEKKWYSMEEDSPQGIWDHIAEKMLLEFAESTCPTFRATTPLSRGKLRSKRHGQISIHYCAD